MPKNWRLLAIAIAAFVTTASGLNIEPDGRDAAKLYHPCEALSVCVREAELCAEGICTFACDDTDDCPADGACAPAVGVCALPCTDGCPEDLTCQGGYCLP